MRSDATNQTLYIRFLLARSEDDTAVEGQNNHGLVVDLWELGGCELELELADDLCDDDGDLETGKGLADAAMPSSSEGLVWRLGSLGDNTKAVVDLLAGVVLLVCGGRHTTLDHPSLRTPGAGLVPDLGVHLGDAGRRDEEVALWDGVGPVLAC